MPAAVKTRFLEKIKGYFNLCSALNQLINLGQRIYGYANFRPFFSSIRFEYGTGLHRSVQHNQWPCRFLLKFRAMLSI